MPGHLGERSRLFEEMRRAGYDNQAMRYAELRGSVAIELQDDLIGAANDK